LHRKLKQNDYAWQLVAETQKQFSNREQDDKLRPAKN